jgi:hypothetical protein
MDDVVLLRDPVEHRNRLLIGVIDRVFYSDDDLVRPIHELVLLIESQ